ncbi:F0F1 ATP synthase subunit delta [Alkaliphilus hydrothermalis]|uniref:ATP synthase subunit delta n=1 Tax=Alkaliphilus hydrothermalis TaxID=1482730 RepID=A0ABS2NQA9_9FIRM|nr:F0F1 ATP synthase subunit delta [Alkaliphilus hydrothermalis]MBM7615127.1 F-type H+-transporting ATPase subunit delta [Alkaliphilus hydrothermalis]
MAELVAKRYAGALYEVAIPLQKQEIFKEELLAILDTLTAHPQFDQLLKSPLIQSQEKKDILTKVFQGKISQEVSNFLYILVDKRRQNHIQEIIHEYKGMVEKAKNMVEAIAITAEAMSKDDLSRLQKKLSLTSGKTVTIKNEIDGSIIGGVLIKMGDQVIDGTIKNRLAQMKEQLSQIIV